MYPATRRSITPRKRNVGIRPRTFNYYCEFALATVLSGLLTRPFWDWLPNHLLVIHILFVFAVLNPLVMPFGLFYFTIEKSTNLCVAPTNASLTSFSHSRHQEPVFACVCKELRREWPDDFDSDHPILSGWYGFLHMKTSRRFDGRVNRTGSCTSTFLDCSELDSYWSFF